MKTVIFATFLMVSLFVGLPSTLADQKPPITPTKPPTVSELIERYSARYGVSKVLVNKIIACESNYNPKAIGDFGHSYGLVQINLPSHGNITKAQALDPEFSISYLVENLAAGNGRIWSCYRMVV